MKLFFDTETTGKADFKRLATDPCQPHMVSCAVVLTDEDCNELQSFRFVCKPSDKDSEPEAAAVHGITRVP